MKSTRTILVTIAVAAATCTAAIGAASAASAASGATTSSAATSVRPLTVHPDSRSTFTLVDVQTGRCLDSNYNGNLYTLPCNGGLYQFWAWDGDAFDNRNTLQDDQTNRLLDSNGAGSAYTLGYSGSRYQDWDTDN